MANKKGKSNAKTGKNSANTSKSNTKKTNVSTTKKTNVSTTGKSDVSTKEVGPNVNEKQNAEDAPSKMKRSLSMVGVILLLGLYLLTFVLAITDNSASLQLFYASVVATIVIPVLIWIYMFVFKLMNKDDEEKTTENNINTAKKNKKTVNEDAKSDKDNVKDVKRT